MLPHWNRHCGLNLQFISQHTDTGSVNSTNDPLTPCVWQGIHSSAKHKSTGMTKRCTEWQPRRGKRSKGWPSTRWQDDSKKGGLLLFVGCLTSQQQASVSQAWICSDNFTCCHTEIEVADQTFYFTHSQYTDTRLTSPSAGPTMLCAWQGSHKSASF